MAVGDQDEVTLLMKFWCDCCVSSNVAVEKHCYQTISVNVVSSNVVVKKHCYQTISAIVVSVLMWL